MVTLYDELMPVHYGFVNLGDEPDPDIDPRRGQRNGLCGSRQPHVLHMVTGLHTGEVPFRVEWTSQAPPPDDSWEDVVETSVEFSQAHIVLGSFEEFIDLELPASGWHRARYSAGGMQEGSDLDTPDEGEEAPDRYLLELWPAPADDDEVVRSGSEIAAYWHGVAQGTRT